MLPSGCCFGGFFINPQFAGAFHRDRHLGFQLVDFDIDLAGHLRESLGLIATG